MTEETLLDAVDKMERAVEHAQGQFSTVRTGRANPALVEKLLVDYYGSPTPLQQIAGFQVPEARTLVVKPHDRNALANIEKAIRESELGLQPSNDGVVIRLYESTGAAGLVRLSGLPSGASVTVVTVTEDVVGPATVVDGSVELALRPWQVVSLMVRR